jgi:hypothetical protein
MLILSPYTLTDAFDGPSFVGLAPIVNVSYSARALPRRLGQTPGWPWAENRAEMGARMPRARSVVPVHSLPRGLVRSRCATSAAIAAALIAVAGCGHQEPPAPAVSPSVALPEPPAPVTGAASVATGLQVADAPAPDSASLPQTHDVARAEGAAFEARRDALWLAIVTDDADRAMPFFFPVGAYQQVKDVASPASDWKHRLVAAYQRDIHALHARLGADAADARFVAFDVPEGRARWIEPGEEWNKIGYYRVFGSKLRYSVAGEERSFEVKSLISWRGEWFVVHLSAIG